MSELICPRTNLFCEYGDYCLDAKNESDLPLSSYDPSIIILIAEAIATMPLDLLNADRSSFCSEERIINIGVAAGVEDDKIVGDDAAKRQQWGIDMINAIDKVRRMRD